MSEQNSGDVTLREFAKSAKTATAMNNFNAGNEQLNCACLEKWCSDITTATVERKRHSVILPILVRRALRMAISTNALTQTMRWHSTKNCGNEQHAKTLTVQQLDI